MRLPKLAKPAKYVGLYVIDFGDHAGVGFTAQEAAELLESEKYRHCKLYKIHRAYPDGRLELKGIPAELFHLEAGMVFYSYDRAAADADFKRLLELGSQTLPPCRAKVHLADYGAGKYAVVIIYPAEYDDELSKWLLDTGYRTAGPAEGGTGAVERYYTEAPKILKRHQFFPAEQQQSRTGQELQASVKYAIQR